MSYATVAAASIQPMSLKSVPEKVSLAVSDVRLQPLLRRLDVALKSEDKYSCGAQPANSKSGLITSGMRDGSAHVLRCLKVWYDLPSDVFFSALLSIDRFLEKMKARPKHLSCIAVSAFHLSCRLHRQWQTKADITIPDTTDLVNISQSRCSPSDLSRMQSILASKVPFVNPTADPEPHVHALSLLRLLFAISKAVAASAGIEEIMPRTEVDEELPNHLLHQLEILACDSVTLQYRPAEVALALLATEFQRLASERPEHSGTLLRLVTELQRVCHIQIAPFADCLGTVLGQLRNYNSEGTVVHRQRLVWKLSNRTLKHLRPTDKLRATLPTIQEKENGKIRLRSNSECSEESMESLSGSDSEREMEMEIEEHDY